MRKQSFALISTAILIPAVLAGCGTSSAGTQSPAAVSKAITVALPAQVSPNWWFPIESSQAFLRLMVKLMP